MIHTMFVIQHPTLGYLCKDGMFTNSLSHSRKFSRQCDATQCLRYSTKNVDFLNECEVNKLEFMLYDSNC